MKRSDRLRLAVACLAAGLAGCEPQDRAPQPPAPPGDAPRPATAPARAPAFLAAVGRSARARPTEAVAEAGGTALARCRTAGARPAGAVFLDSRPTADPNAIGAFAARLRAALGVPTWGMTCPADPDAGGELAVLLLAGDRLSVTARALPGRIAHAPRDDPAAVAAFRRRRAACRDAGAALAERLPSPPPGSVVLVLAPLEGDWTALFATGFRRRTGTGSALLAAGGGWGASVAGEGIPAGPGALAVSIRGPFRAVVASRSSRDRWDPAACRREAAGCAAEVRARPGAPAPALLLAFGSMHRAGGWQADRRAITGALGADVPVFGAPTRGQASADAGGALAAGSGRLAVCALVPLPGQP